MEIKPLNKTGWFIGNFPEAILQSPFEVGVKFMTKGKEKPHYHKETTEITAIISGKHRINNKVLKPKDIVIIYPNEWCKYECLEDGALAIFRSGDGQNDKYY